MTTKRTRQGCQVTTSYGKTPERGLPVEHVTLECTQPMLCLVEDTGKFIYDESTVFKPLASRHPFR
jgi:hypothetical protein